MEGLTSRLEVSGMADHEVATVRTPRRWNSSARRLPVKDLGTARIPANRALASEEEGKAGTDL